MSIADTFPRKPASQGSRARLCNASSRKSERHVQRSQSSSHALSTQPPNLFDSPVSALGAVEQVHLLLLLRSGSAHVALVGVRLRIHDAGGLAESRDANAMPET